MKRSELKGIIAGMLLGDSSICMAKNRKNAYMRIQHGLKQSEYLRHKVEFLEELTRVAIGDIGGKYPGIYARSVNHPLYTRTRKLAYPEGKKVVSLTWVNWLTVQGLAIWYMDDGSLVKRYTENKSGRRRIHSRFTYLSTCSFSLEENELLISFIKERFGIEFKLKKDGKYYRLRLGAPEANKFFSLIEPYIIPSMLYKIDMQYERPQLAV